MSSPRISFSFPNWTFEGKGDARSWGSCSHGAGRQMSRTKAREQVAQHAFERAMDGILWDDDASLRDEAPQAYKDLDEVMRQQESCVRVRHRLLPLINVKGVSDSHGGARQQRGETKRRKREGRRRSRRALREGSANAFR